MKTVWVFLLTIMMQEDVYTFEMAAPNEVVCGIYGYNADVQAYEYPDAVVIWDCFSKEVAAVDKNGNPVMPKQPPTL